MRDKKLLPDLLAFLKNHELHEGHGRLRLFLIKRIQLEIKADPDELGKLCATFIHLFDSPQSDCQPTKPWEALAGKVRQALSKPKEIIPIEDPILSASSKLLLEAPQKEEDESGFLYPFNNEDDRDLVLKMFFDRQAAKNNKP